MNDMKNGLAVFALFLFVILFAIFFLSGCTSTVSKDCGAIDDSHWIERDICHHQKAMEYAVMGDNVSAINECELVRGSWDVIKQGAPSRNTCFSDIAEVLKDPNICERVKSETILNIGVGMVKESCLTRAQKVEPVCPNVMIFFGALFFSSFVFMARKEKRRSG